MTTCDRCGRSIPHGNCQYWAGWMPYDGKPHCVGGGNVQPFDICDECFDPLSELLQKCLEEWKSGGHVAKEDPPEEEPLSPYRKWRKFAVLPLPDDEYWNVALEWAIGQAEKYRGGTPYIAGIIENIKSSIRKGIEP